LSDQPAGFIELGAKPAQNRWSVWDFSVFERGKQTSFAASALLGFQNAVPMAGLSHVGTALFAADSSSAHFKLLLAKSPAESKKKT
jgi:hypothetical protein